MQASTDGGTTWTSLDGTAGGEPFVRTASDQPAISGSSDGEWVDVNVPLDAYAGQAIELRFLYDTDGGVAPDGFFADEVSVVADEAPVFTSGATLHVNGRASFIRGQNAQPVFDDSRPNWFPEIPQNRGQGARQRHPHPGGERRRHLHADQGQLQLVGPTERQHGVSPGSGTGPGGTSVHCL